MEKNDFNKVDESQLENVAGTNGVNQIVVGDDEEEVQRVTAKTYFLLPVRIPFRLLCIPKIKV